VRPKISTFPLSRPFERQDASTSLSEFSLRLIADFYPDSPTVVGSCVIFCGHLLLTAKHVLTDYVYSDRAGHTLHAVQILQGPQYAVWPVVRGWSHSSSDLALLHLAERPDTTDMAAKIEHRQFVIDPFPPQIGESVAAFGYHSSQIKVSKNPNGSNHIDLRDEPTMSVGRVKALYPKGRDKTMLPFPCFEVDARFDGGMSGGPVFDETGAVCGLVCSGFHGAHENGPPISYVATLWPIFGMTISANRGECYPRDVNYPVVQLARGGQVRVPDRSMLEEKLAFPDWVPSSSTRQFSS
jgi:hypothetical protein